MSSPRSRVNILWLDDLLVQEAQWFLHLRRFITHSFPNVKLIEVTEIDGFSRVLKERAGLRIQDEGYVDWIWLDVMLKPHTSKPVFDALGFQDKPQESMRAGAQILDIMQNPFYFDDQPEWLRPYRGRRTSLLTCLLDIKSDWSAVVDLSVRRQQDRFSALVKHLKYGTNTIEPDQNFKNHITERLHTIASELTFDAVEGVRISNDGGTR